jgi:hypothetical protein
MRPVFVVIADVLFQQPSQMPVIANNHVIQQVAPHTTNPGSATPFCQGTAERSAKRLTAHRLRYRDNLGTEL